MEPFYRAKLTLEKVEPFTNKYDQMEERRTEIAAINVTGDTPGDAMYQIHDHAGALHQWHEEPAAAPAPLTPEEANERIGNAFSQLSKAAQTWLRPKPPAEPTAELQAEPATDDEPDTVQFRYSEYADKLTFTATPTWLTNALETGDIRGVFKCEDYWYLEVKTREGVITAEPGDTIHRHYDGGLLVRSPDGLCKKTMTADEPDDLDQASAALLTAVETAEAAQRDKPLRHYDEIGDGEQMPPAVRFNAA